MQLHFENPPIKYCKYNFAITCLLQIRSVTDRGNWETDISPPDKSTPDKSSYQICRGRTSPPAPGK